MAIPCRTANFKSANILLIAIWGSTAKFNARQYFRLYGIFKNLLLITKIGSNFRAKYTMSYMQPCHDMELTLVSSLALWWGSVEISILCMSYSHTRADYFKAMRVKESTFLFLTSQR